MSDPAQATISVSDEQKAIEAEKVELSKLEAQLKTEEDKLILRKRREDLVDRERRLRGFQEIDSKSKLDEIERKKTEEETRRREEEIRKQEAEDEKERVANLCSFLPEEERSQLAWSVFRINDDKTESQVTTIPLDPSVNIYDAIRAHVPEGGEFRLKLLKGNVFATRPALASLVKTDEAKKMIQDMPLYFKTKLYGKNERDGFWRSQADERFRARAPFDARDVRRAVHGGELPEEVRARADREKDLMKAVLDSNEKRLVESKEAANEQLKIITSLMKDGKSKEAETAMKSLQEDVRRLSDGGGQNGQVLSIFKESAAAQAEASKEVARAQADAMKAAITGQADVQKQIMQMQVDSMKSTFSQMMGDFKGIIEGMSKERERDREFTREMMSMWKDQTKDQIDALKEKRADKTDSEKLMTMVTGLSGTLLTSTAKAMDTQLAMAERVNKMMKRISDGDKDEDEEPKTGLDKIMEVMQPPLLKMLDIAMEQVKQGKSPDEVRAQLPNFAREYIQKNPIQPPAPGGPAREGEKASEGGRDMMEAMLADHRDDVIPIVVSAIEKNSDEDWLVTMILGEDFDSGARAALALLPVKKIIDKMLKFADEDEKKVLGGDRAVPYLERVQARLIDMQKKLKQLAEAEMAKSPQTPPSQ